MDEPLPIVLKRDIRIFKLVYGDQDTGKFKKLVQVSSENSKPALAPKGCTILLGEASEMFYEHKEVWVMRILNPDPMFPFNTFVMMDEIGNDLDAIK